MNIIMRVRKSRKRDYLFSLASFFLKKFPVHTKFDLIISTQNNLTKDTGGLAATCKNENDIEIIFDNKANGKELLLSMAHEMIHVRQFAYGELQYKDDIPHWYGEPISKTKYKDLPWEIEAYDKMIDLLRAIPPNISSSCLHQIG